MPSSTSYILEEQKKSNITKFNLLWLIVTVLVFSALVKLGLWQSARGIRKGTTISEN